MTLSKIFKQIYFKSTGYSYTNLGRLFLRLFVGIMLMQFGIREIMNFGSAVAHYPSILGMGSTATLIIMICIETVCSLFIMCGFLTRLMTIPPFLAMIIAECVALSHTSVAHTWLLPWWSSGYLPIMFLGIFFFLLLVGPGKISVDYFYSLYLIHHDDGSESELEEV